MKVENLGEIFLDGKTIRLDNTSVQDLDNLLIQVKEKEQKCLNKLNYVLAEIQ